MKAGEGKPEVNLVWLKRDLRLRDHEALAAAIAAGKPILLFYCFEPSLMQAPDTSDRHWRFVWQSLLEMRRELVRHECSLNIFLQELPDLLETLSAEYHVSAIFSHQETGTRLTFERDKDVAKWCRKNQVNWREFRQHGVSRPLSNRQGWQKAWKSMMAKPQIHPDLHKLETLHCAPEKQMVQPPKTWEEKPEGIQMGGEAMAHRYLQSFLQDRFHNYSRHISKPLKSRRSCSRLSPYLAWGNLSARQVWQATQKRKSEVKNKRPLTAFLNRLQWRCHFIQKFESEDSIEFENLNRAFDDLGRREDAEQFEAWRTGNTGIPLVDACMRCLISTGFLNFRMRAMLVSVLTQHFWQPWRPGALWVAQQFLDYEPGIHFCQFQMQAGVLGVQVFRVYNPVKQAEDHDPEGIFIRKWVPELANLPIPVLFAPWKMTPLEQALYQFELGKDYPVPLIDLEAAGKNARDRLFSTARTPLAKKEGKRYIKKHVNPGSRRGKKQLLANPSKPNQQDSV